jgi:hypothetical protein
MEQQKLPNATTALILGIVSFICCCFSNGIGGVIMAGIALFLTKKDFFNDTATTEIYTNFGTVKTAKIISWISMVISLIIVGILVFQIIEAGGIQAWYEQSQEQQREILEQLGIELD